MRNVVIVQIAGWADTCVSSFVVQALKDKNPEVKVTLVTGQSLSDWAGCLHFDEVIFADDSALGSSTPASIWELGRLAMLLRGKKFDLGFNLSFGFNYGRKFGQLMKWGGIEKTIGFDVGSKDLYDFNVPRQANVSDIDKILSLLSAIDVKPTKLNFKLKVRQQIHEEIMRRLAGIELRSKNFIVVAPGGGENPQRKFHHKRWTHFSELIRLTLDRTKYPVLLVGGEADLSLYAKLTAVDPLRVHSWIGKLTKEESLAVIGEAFAFVGNDSGPSFVAGSAGVPSVVLFGPTSSRIHHPVGKDKTLICIDGKVPCFPCGQDDGSFDWACRDNACMKTISPEQVWSVLAGIAKL